MSSDRFYYVQGNTDNSWMPAQKWQRKFFNSIETNNEETVTNGKNIYYGFKVKDCDPIKCLDRENILEEMNLIFSDKVEVKSSTSWFSFSSEYKTIKKLKFNVGVMCNLLTKTSRIYVGITPRLDHKSIIKTFPHKGVLMIDDESLDKFAAIHASKNRDLSDSSGFTKSPCKSLSYDKEEDLVTEDKVEDKVEDNSRPEPEKDCLEDVDLDEMEDLSVDEDNSHPEPEKDRVEYVDPAKTKDLQSDEENPLDSPEKNHPFFFPEVEEKVSIGKSMGNPNAINTSNLGSFFKKESTEKISEEEVENMLTDLSIPKSSPARSGDMFSLETPKQVSPPPPSPVDQVGTNVSLSPIAKMDQKCDFSGLDKTGPFQYKNVDPFDVFSNIPSAFPVLGRK